MEVWIFLPLSGQLFPPSNISCKDNDIPHGGYGGILASHTPSLLLSQSPSFCPHPRSKSFPSCWMSFTAPGLPQNDHLNPSDLTDRGHWKTGFLCFYDEGLTALNNPDFITFIHRYEQPKCDGNARAHPNKAKDHYKTRHLQGTSAFTGICLYFSLFL